MRFAFTDDQLLFRDTVRDLLRKECPPAAVRAAWVDDDGHVPDVWRALVWHAARWDIISRHRTHHGAQAACEAHARRAEG